MARSGDDARTALLDAAERLFAENGVHGVSLRDVSAAAGQRNHSAIQYHFADRVGLIVAVYERRMSVINAHRLALIQGAEGDDRSRDLPTLVKIGVLPLIDHVCANAGWYGRFLLRTRTDPVAAAAIRDHPMREGHRVNARRIQKALDHLPPKVRRHRGEEMINLFVSSAANWEWARDRQQNRLSSNELANELVSTGLALLQAPVLVRAA